MGTIESVEGEIVAGWAEPDAEFQVRALTAAEFRIDDRIKGDIAADRIKLSFDPELAGSSCGDLLFGFEPGHRMILMLGSAGEDGRYPAPLVWPRRLHLGPAEEAFREFPLYQYVAGIGNAGVAPIRVAFAAPDVVHANEILNIELQIDNDMEEMLRVIIGSDRPGTDREEGTVLRIEASGIEALGEWPEAFVVEPRSSRSVDLADYFSSTDSGHYQWKGFLDLPRSANEVYRDHWYEPGKSLYQLAVQDVTGVAAGSWGRLKSGGE